MASYLPSLTRWFHREAVIGATLDLCSSPGKSSLDYKQIYSGHSPRVYPHLLKKECQCGSSLLTCAGDLLCNFLRHYLNNLAPPSSSTLAVTVDTSRKFHSMLTFRGFILIQLLLGRHSFP